ncbi:proline-rich receptor-like protein kinase PERK9 [Penaeus monodon]|uniref:proline-rich receptor-like protein kinase PERK9 n=1 Tax=Penaeus monodon TaxID=6687 RepID=UPI0018A7DF9B|nr:proline-rich receptor-like protein kinase PERK9 [Penaeus monodon]
MSPYGKFPPAHFLIPTSLPTAPFPYPASPFVPRTTLFLTVPRRLSHPRRRVPGAPFLIHVRRFPGAFLIQRRVPGAFLIHVAAVPRRLSSSTSPVSPATSHPVRRFPAPFPNPLRRPGAFLIHVAFSPAPFLIHVAAPRGLSSSTSPLSRRLSSTSPFPGPFLITFARPPAAFPPSTVAVSPAAFLIQSQFSPGPSYPHRRSPAPFPFHVAFPRRLSYHVRRPPTQPSSSTSPVFPGALPIHVAVPGACPHPRRRIPRRLSSSTSVAVLPALSCIHVAVPRAFLITSPSPGAFPHPRRRPPEPFPHPPRRPPAPVLIHVAVHGDFPHPTSPFPGAFPIKSAVPRRLSSSTSPSPRPIASSHPRRLSPGASVLIHVGRSPAPFLIHIAAPEAFHHPRRRFPGAFLIPRRRSGAFLTTSSFPGRLS